MAKDIETQKTNIIKHILKHGSITPLEALDLYGCFRLAARILDIKKFLRNSNVAIVTRMEETSESRYARYVLVHTKNDQFSDNQLLRELA